MKDSLKNNGLSKVVVHMKHSVRNLGAILALGFAVGFGNAQAAQVGYYEMCKGEGNGWAVTPISSAGHTPVYLSDLTAADLNGLDVLFVTNCNNLEYAAEYLNRLPFA